MIFQDWRVRRKVRKIERVRDRALAPIDSQISAAKKQRDYEKAQQLISELFFEKDQFDEEINSLVTHHLLREAGAYMLPVPSTADEEMWQESSFTGKKYLTPAGIMQLRTLIRGEKRHQREALAFWITSAVGVLGAITGVIGVIVAFLALSAKG